MRDVMAVSPQDAREPGRFGCWARYLWSTAAARRTSSAVGISVPLSRGERFGPDFASGLRAGEPKPPPGDEAPDLLLGDAGDNLPGQEAGQDAGVHAAAAGELVLRDPEDRPGVLDFGGERGYRFTNHCVGGYILCVNAVKCHLRNTDIGRRIKAARELKGWTQRQLADRAGVSTPTISRWEGGDDHPSGQNAVRVAQALGIDLKALLEGAGQPAPDGTSVRRRDDEAVLNDIADHLIREFSPIVSSITEDRRRQIVRHLKQQISLLAGLARDSMGAVDQVGGGPPTELPSEPRRAAAVRRAGRQRDQST